MLMFEMMANVANNERKSIHGILDQIFLRYSRNIYIAEENRT